ncbi:MAG TPA: flavodoxin domain-containing protein [Candidatus Limnocylindria bacterium]|nr:flavodoxin domain-containing protein [Candidatus Limnocylindria bacterium]
MKAIVVYESHWGNTATVARAIAEGIGRDAIALTTDAADTAALADADLIVVGAPVLGFSLASDGMRASLSRSEAGAPVPPDLSHPSMKSWLDALPEGHSRTAAFETRIWWSPRGATGDIERRLERAGHVRAAKAQKFVVEDKYGPLRKGEVDRARAWGAALAAAVDPSPDDPKED